MAHSANIFNAVNMYIEKNEKNVENTDHQDNPKILSIFMNTVINDLLFFKNHDIIHNTKETG